jgi:hypothetical protein
MLGTIAVVPIVEVSSYINISRAMPYVYAGHSPHSVSQSLTLRGTSILREPPLARA